MRAEWRAWLEANHQASKEIWLVLTKDGRKGSALTMKDAVDEAICFGWIDSRTKRLDDAKYMLRLTPRKNVTKWSDRNLQRARDLIDEGRMTDAGMLKLPREFKGSAPDIPSEQEATLPPELERALNGDIVVQNAFRTLTPGRRKEFIRWVSGAKRPGTRQKRVDRTVELIRMGRSLTEDMMNRWSKK